MQKRSEIEILSGIDQLPILPAAVRQIQRLLARPDSILQQIAAVISRDQAVAGRVIRLVNSAFYGLPNRVGSIHQAIVILGLNTVKNLTLGVAVIRTFENGRDAGIFDREQFWMHSFATALAGREIALALRLKDPEDYFLAGLLHDIGILVQDQFFHEEFVELLKRTMMDRVEFPEAEQKVFCESHAVIGQFIARNWNVPDFIADTLRWHHDPFPSHPDDPDSLDKIRIVHAADGLTRERGLGRFVEYWIRGPHPEILSGLGLSEIRLDAILDKTGNEVRALMREWGI